jgi:hypothetical protein
LFKITSAGEVAGDIFGWALLKPRVFADRLYERRQNLVVTGLPGGRYVAADHQCPLGSGTKERVAYRHDGLVLRPAGFSSG